MMAAGDPWHMNVRTCCCVGYLTNPGGRCCMDMPSQTVASDKIIIGKIEPDVVVQGWQCPLCRKVYAPHVEACGCQAKDSVI